jgi:hypothetical protein
LVRLDVLASCWAAAVGVVRVGPCRKFPERRWTGGRGLITLHGWPSREVSTAYQHGRTDVAFRPWTRLVLSAFGGSVLALLAASFLNIWIVWYVNDWEGVGYHKSLWSVLTEVSQPHRDVQVHAHDGDIIQAAVIMVLGAAIGSVIGWCMGRLCGGGRVVRSGSHHAGAT